jgi:predicted DCC family thiol-disulfide oxidoreductase YuxK
MTRYTVLYDGNCRICSSQIELIKAHDDNGLLEILDMNSPEARARFPQVTPIMAQREMHLVAPDGTLHRGAEAVRETLLRLPNLRLLGELMGLPGAMALARPVYAWVARNRYLFGGRVPCEDDTCER